MHPGVPSACSVLLVSIAAQLASGSATPHRRKKSHSARDSCSQYSACVTLGRVPHVDANTTTTITIAARFTREP
ncbi:MAG: hypothetical protein ABTQ32_00905 [Myxococcaceae bacterium]